MSRSRFIRNRRRRDKRKAFEVDITSLLDVLVILLVFLLKHYNTGTIINIPPGIELPMSESKSINEPGVLVQISREKIWVDDQEVYDSQTFQEQLYDDGNRRIIPLFDELVKKRESFEQLFRTIENASEFKGMVNLVVDKEMNYTELKRVMYTCAVAGYRTYKFIVLENEGKKNLSTD